MKKSEIRFSIALDENKIPEAISWSATDAGPDIHFAKAINIALWDREQVGTMKIDLWTKDMPVDEMKRFCVDNIGSMAENIVTATDDMLRPWPATPFNFSGRCGQGCPQGGWPEWFWLVQSRHH
jgi:gliding motility-associated protein GldC